ncbi:helix-turn-helix domain-containing protein [Streptomyces sp. NPDC004542]|uniref:AraC-like ligand-binding domain-containing protein n=1 Tax=Streptomyces sp. NPDC004542 TaxID=3154281 RepID=UPI0033ADD167
MSQTLSTAPLAASEREECWHDVVSRTFVPLDVTLLEKEPSPGTIVSERLGELRIVQVRAGPQAVTRSRRLIARDDHEYLTLSIQQRGTAVTEQDGRRARLHPGDFALSDTSRPFRKLLEGEFAFTAFHFPRRELHVGDEDLRAVTATAFNGDRGSAALVATYFMGMARGAAGFDDAVRRRVAVTALDLLAVLIEEHRGRGGSRAPETAEEGLARVKDHIMRHLADPGLSPATIAAATFMSVRRLHKLFELEGATVAGWIRTQRLERCRRDLLRPTALEIGVAGIARRWGFVSPSHFSRAFRAAYGMSPREWQGSPDTRGSLPADHPGLRLPSRARRGGPFPAAPSAVPGRPSP